MGRSVHVHMHSYRYQRAICRNRLSPSTMWALGIEFRSSCSVASTFPILLTLILFKGLFYILFIVVSFWLFLTCFCVHLLPCLFFKPLLSLSRLSLWGCCHVFVPAALIYIQILFMLISWLNFFFIYTQMAMWSRTRAWELMPWGQSLFEFSVFTVSCDLTTICKPGTEMYC